MMTDSEDTMPRAFFGSFALERLADLIPPGQSVAIFFEQASLAVRPMLGPLQEILAGRQVELCPLQQNGSSTGGTGLTGDRRIIMLGEGGLPRRTGGRVAPDVQFQDPQGIFLCLNTPLCTGDLEKPAPPLAACIGDTRAAALQRPVPFVSALLKLAADIVLCIAGGTSDIPCTPELQARLEDTFRFMVREGPLLAGLQEGPVADTRTRMIELSWNAARDMLSLRNGLHALQEFLEGQIEAATATRGFMPSMPVLQAILDASDEATTDRTGPLMTRAWNLQWGDNRVRTDEGSGRLALWARQAGIPLKPSDRAVDARLWEDTVHRLCRSPELPARDRIDTTRLAESLLNRY